MLVEKYKSEIDSILSRYPVKRSALIPMLYLAQQCSHEQMFAWGKEMVQMSDTNRRVSLGFFTID